MRIDRMLAITIMLLNRNKVTAKELAQKFEVSLRTIYRDIEAINLAGIPIISLQGNTGGFSIVESYKLNHQLFTPDNISAILSSLKGINNTLQDIQLDSAIEKITALIPKEKREYLNLHLEQFVVDILPWGYNERLKDKIKEIQPAITSQQLIHFEYCNSKGENSVRVVEPMTIVFKGYTWYLFGFCQLKSDYRIFRLSRIKKLKVLTDNFDRKDKSYRDFANIRLHNSKEVELILKFSSNISFKVRDYFDDDQIETLKNGDLIVRITFPEDDWIYNFILSYGEGVEVLGPPHIRKKITEKAQKILSNYQT